MSSIPYHLPLNNIKVWIRNPFHKTHFIKVTKNGPTESKFGAVTPTHICPPLRRIAKCDSVKKSGGIGATHKDVPSLLVDRENKLPLGL